MGVCVEGLLLSSAYCRSLCLPQGDGEVEMGEEAQEDESGLLTIHDVTRAHAGIYQCTADNGIAPPASVNVQLVVQCECFYLFFLSLRGGHTCVFGSFHSCLHGFCMNNLHAYLAVCSQTRASERSPVEEGSK